MVHNGSVIIMSILNKPFIHKLKFVVNVVAGGTIGIAISCFHLMSNLAWSHYF